VHVKKISSLFLVFSILSPALLHAQSGTLTFKCVITQLNQDIARNFPVGSLSLAGDPNSNPMSAHVLITTRMDRSHHIKIGLNEFDSAKGDSIREIPIEHVNYWIRPKDKGYVLKISFSETHGTISFWPKNSGGRFNWLARLTCQNSY
jgi:hypothetical protein